jgi:DNA-binding MarR family transcriptional regulator
MILRANRSYNELFENATDRSVKKREAGEPGGPRPFGPAFLLAQLGAHAALKFGERMAALDLTPAHAGILRAISASEGMSQKALAHLLRIVPSRLVELLDDLGQRGLVERRDDEDDRRVYALHLTRKGLLALEAIGRVGREHQEALLAALTPAEREALGSLLGRVAEEQGLTPGVHPGFSRTGSRRRDKPDL